MSYTLDEDGKALSETTEGISMPIDNSFESVNNWIHGTDVQYEEVEAVCLGLASENDRLRAKLKNHVLLPVGTDNIGNEEFFDNILIHFVGKKGNAATAIENHRLLCDYLQSKNT